MNLLKTVANGTTWICVKERTLCESSASIDFFGCLYFALSLIWMAMVVYNCYLIWCIYCRILEIPLPKPRATTPCTSTASTIEPLPTFNAMPLPGIPPTRPDTIPAHAAEKPNI
ncbi:unnamed protein product [Cylicocyclus nassatus]|uniref:Uncharacterized protein n=1 Tax=Cylicocyclus nassatus TaxID=53992 RepID=A0AA36GP02_CYLNA|nr:unnamed protein product [Cylicocyclus nassatus]